MAARRVPRALPGLIILTGLLIHPGASPSASATSPAGATDPIAAKVDALIDPLQRPGAPGGAVAVMRGGKVVYSRGYGLASVEHGVPSTPDTAFDAASLAKQFTAFAIALLAHQGRLDLDDAVRRHLHEVPEFEHPLTLRHLIHHTSGLRDEMGLLVLAGWRYDDLVTTGDVLGLVSRMEELHPAGRGGGPRRRPPLSCLDGGERLQAPGDDQHPVRRRPGYGGAAPRLRL